MRLIYWSQMVIGLWVLTSPWTLGYSFVTPALWSAVFSGALIFILSLWGLFGFDDRNNGKL